MSTSQRIPLLWGVLAAVLALRLLGLGAYPLMDTSEARYGEMARKMLELDDWITPMFTYEQPFWGKPPLSFWTQAASMHWLGIGEFALRLPAWLIQVFSCLLIIHVGKRERSLEVGILAAIIYCSCCLGLVASGVVLTDPALSFGLLLAYVGFWYAMAHGESGAARMGFVGLGLGLLAKGPLTLVLFAIPALLWVAKQHQWRQLVNLPWLSGLSIMLAIALPWYVLAEIKSPGFLDYFLVGEHWKRYVISEWSGDLYGSAHAKPLGTIWLYLLGALFPWSLLLPLIYLRRKANNGDAFCVFLWFWALATPIFFSLAGNILWTYVLPALPAWALLLAENLTRARCTGERVVVGTALALPILAMLLIIIGVLEQRPQNQREIVQAWQRANVTQPAPLFYLGRRSYSAEFYSAGAARHVKSEIQLPTDREFYLARRLRDLSSPLHTSLACLPIAQANSSQLFRCRSMPKKQSIRAVGSVTL